MNTATNIYNKRCELGYTPIELAERCGVSRATIYKWESGKSVPTGESLLKLASALHTTCDFILNNLQ